MAHQYMGVAQSGSASGLGPEGRGFESHHLYHLVDFVNRAKFAAALSVLEDIKLPCMLGREHNPVAAIYRMNLNPRETRARLQTV